VAEEREIAPHYYYYLFIIYYVLFPLSLPVIAVMSAGRCRGVCHLCLPGTCQADQRRADARGTTLRILHQAEVADVGVAGRYQHLTRRW